MVNPATRQAGVTITNMHFLTRLSLARFDEQAGGSLHIVGLDIVLSGALNAEVVQPEKELILPAIA